MCECGCFINSTKYKLPSPNGWYVVLLSSGCKDCGVGSSISILPCSDYYDDELEFIPEFPVVGEGADSAIMISCGMSPAEAERAAVATISGTALGVDSGMVIDAYMAEVLGEDLWNDHLKRSPIVINPLKEQ